MEKFKVILKAALANKATQIDIKIGELILFHLGNQTASIKELGPIESSWINQLFSNLFANQKNNTNILTGQLNIEGAGVVYLLGKKENPSLIQVFLPPNGKELFEKILTSFHALDNKEVHNPLNNNLDINSINQNKQNLALIASNNPEIIQCSEKHLTKNNLHSIVIKNKIDFNYIIDRFVPHFIFLDQNTNDHDEIYKKIYNLNTHNRINIFVVYLSRIFKSSDTKAAFVNSVDYILNFEDLNKMDLLLDEAKNRKQDIFKIYNAKTEELVD